MTLKDSERTRCEIWSRVMGYHRPLSAWNPGKVQEYRDRKLYKERHEGSFPLFRRQVSSR